MAILKRAELLRRYNEKQSYLLTESGEKSHAAKQLKKHSESFSVFNTYDIFLSHSYDDARIIKQIKEMLEKKGYSVYVDWIEDSHLDRGNVNVQSASLLRNRMDCCSSLIYVTSESAETSVWMPWELGYMDAKVGRVAIAPILDEDTTFEGREYLGLYPYLDLTNDSFYIHRKLDEWVNLEGWMKGENPKKAILS
jgi:hypothetical protein